MTLVLLSVLQIYVPLLLVNSGDDPLVHNSLLTIPRTLSGIATVQVSCHLKDMERLKKYSSSKKKWLVLDCDTISDKWKKDSLFNKVTDWNK